MKIWSIAIIILVLGGIVFTMVFEKHDWDLGNNYYYLPSYEAIDTGFPEGSVIYKSNQRDVFSEIKIYGEVTGVNHDEKFIIATQLKGEKVKIDNSTIVKYFIVVKKTDAVYGPFSEKEYIQKREELGVPKDLQLQK